MASRIKGQIYEIENKLFRVCAVIGEGSFANVFLAKGMEDSQYYALKIMKQYKDQQKQLIDEQINIQKKFKGNKYVIQYLGQKLLPGNMMCLVLQLGECSLKNWLELTKELSQKELLNIITQTLQGLGSVHKNSIIHRDIKPENIIKKNNVYKITDFGVSYQGEEDSTITGTPLYWPPEMLRSVLGEQQVPLTKKFDVWALGTTIFQVYFKVNPFFPYNRQQYAECKPIKLSRIMWQNISKLTPNFTMQKFISFLQQNKLNNEAQFVKKKMKKTNQVIIEALCSNFFEVNPNKRPDCSQILQLFQMLKDSLVVPETKKTKSYPKWSMDEVPEDIKVFCQAKDLFYEFSQQFKTKYDQRVLFSLELGIWYLQGAIYGGVNYIVLDKMQQIKPYRKPAAELWQELKSKLSEYYFQVKGEEQYRDFDKLVYLKVYILVCSIWWSIIRDETKYFCKMIEKITGLEITHPIHIFTHIELYSDKCINDIEHALISRYYT